jgi:hypothetical protein
MWTEIFISVCNFDHIIEVTKCREVYVGYYCTGVLLAVLLEMNLHFGCEIFTFVF